MSKRKSVVSDGRPSIPDRFIETVLIKVKNGEKLAINVRNSDHCVTRIHSDSPLFQQINVGDRIIAINGHKLDLKKLYEEMKDNRDKTFHIKVEHLSFSRCDLLKTTLECISTEKENEKVIGRAVNVILVDFTPPEIRSPLGLQIRYDARERIEVCNVIPRTLSSIHLRPGDIIREVNGRSVCSKSMCMALIQQSFHAFKVVNLVIETAVNGHDSYREQEEMPEDVMQIAKKQIEFLRRAAARPTPKSISIRRPISVTNVMDPLRSATESPSTRTARLTPESPPVRTARLTTANDPPRVSVAPIESTEFEHTAEMDPKKLKSCKSVK